MFLFEIRIVLLSGSWLLTSEMFCFSIMADSFSCLAEGSTSNVSGSGDLESRGRPQQQNPLIPMMLSPPESLLVSCVLRGNFTEAHQVNELCVPCAI